MLRTIVVTALCLLVATGSARPAVLEGESVAILSELFAAGGYGRFSTERAVFITVAEDGSLQCHAWPAGGDFQSASYGGAVPPRVIAIAHTHPNHAPEPSLRDRAVATQLNVPVLVVTRSSVIAAMPGVERSEVFASGNWTETVAHRRCLGGSAR